MYFLACWAGINLISLLAVVPLLIVIPIPLFFDEGGGNALILLALIPIYILVLLIFSVFFVVLFFVAVLFQHAFIFLFARRDQKGLSATLKVSCYSSGVYLLIAWLPLVGILAIFYYSYLYVIGLMYAHSLSALKVTGAVLLPTIISLGIMIFGGFLGFKALQPLFESSQYPVPEPEALSELPPGSIGAAALRDDSESQDRIRKLRDASYSGAIPDSDNTTQVTILTSDPRDEDRGVRGSASGPGSEAVTIEPDDPTSSTGDTGRIVYDTAQDEGSSPEDYYEERIVQPVLWQRFTLRGVDSYTINLEQAGREPRIITVRSYSDAGTRESSTYFHLPFRISKPGTKFRLRVEPMPLDELRLEIDRDGDGSYEESWMPEASVQGNGASNDSASPVTTARLEDDPQRSGPLLTLDAIDKGGTKSGVGIIYYWINDSGPRIYLRPVPVEDGDAITYWSIDRDGNVEWRRTVDVNR